MNQIKTTHRQVVTMNNILRSLREVSNLNNIHLSYSIAKNIRLMEQHLATFKDIGKPSEDYMKYENARIKLNAECAQKDARKQPRIIDNKFIIDPEKQVFFDESMKALVEEHKSAIDEQNKKQMDIEKMLDDECTIDVHKMKLSWFPNTFKPGDLEILMDLIEDDLEAN